MKQKHKWLPRILISLLGLALILMGLSAMMLGFFGESAPATITQVRREGGERTDGKPGRYTYNISYTFTLHDGTVMDGFTKKISDAAYMKTSGLTGTRTVKYFAPLPFINVLEEDSGPGAGQFILIGAGLALIFLMNRKNSPESD